MGVSAKDALSGISGAYGNTSKPTDPSLNKAKTADYTITGREANWFKSLPYGFKAKINGETRVVYLPINPSNLNIVTHYATNVITTLYDTVEEHSEVRYFDITIAGTTGFVPLYINDPDNPTPEGNITAETDGRREYQSGGVFANLAGGFMQQTLGRLDAALNSASSAVNSILGKNNKFQVGVFNQQSGYVAFHNLYKFFLDYKDSILSGSATPTGTDFSSLSSAFKQKDPTMLLSAISPSGSSSTPLTFLNYKDNNQYSVAVQSFSLERSAENPMLYNYRITMRGYNLQTIGTNVNSDDYLKDRLAALGLDDGAASIASRFKGGLSNGKAALNSLKGALGSLGR